MSPRRLARHDFLLDRVPGELQIEIDLARAGAMRAGACLPVRPVRVFAAIGLRRHDQQRAPSAAPELPTDVAPARAPHRDARIGDKGQLGIVGAAISASPTAHGRLGAKVHGCTNQRRNRGIPAIAGIAAVAPGKLLHMRTGPGKDRLGNRRQIARRVDAGRLPELAADGNAIAATRRGQSGSGVVPGGCEAITGSTCVRGPLTYSVTCRIARSAP